MKINPNLLKLAEQTYDPDLKVDTSLVQQPIQTPNINVQNPQDYIILEGRHGTYEYPDLLVSKYRLSYNPEVEKVANILGLKLSNTSKEKNGRDYIGNINWINSLRLNLELNGFTLNPRQGIDFISLLKSGKAFDGNENKIDSKELERILDEIIGVRNPGRAEWLDADFKYLNKAGKEIQESEKGNLYIYYNHVRDANGNLIPRNRKLLEECLMDNCKIDLSGCNKQGMPTKEGDDINYWRPMKDNNSVAGFYASSGRALLDCLSDPLLSYSGLGVRIAKIKEQK
ncbi:hypothetical protein J4427_00980 [Candidatus Woesearchaeota archaeon]|nr:hypothetical protein [uncultured archaeon]MBS3163245.1 hypothetical protein [Candidatus Woesearchaeota archaeon]